VANGGVFPNTCLGQWWFDLEHASAEVGLVNGDTERGDNQGRKRQRDPRESEHAHRVHAHQVPDCSGPKRHDAGGQQQGGPA
jgi:hypothetical protein